MAKAWKNMFDLEVPIMMEKQNTTMEKRSSGDAREVDDIVDSGAAVFMRGTAKRAVSRIRTARVDEAGTENNI